MVDARSDRPRRVLHVCTILLTARVFIAPVVRHLQSVGYEVAVACSSEQAADGPELPTDTGVAGCPLFPVQIPRQIRPIGDLIAVYELYKVIARFKPQIVHTQTSKAGIVGRLAAWLAGVPIIVHTAHAFSFHPYLPPMIHWLYVLIEKWAGRFADVVLVDTDSVRAEGLRYGVVTDPKKLVTIPMGIDLKKFSPFPIQNNNIFQVFGIMPQSLVVGTIARLVPDKGLDCFIKMASLVLTQCQGVHFLIVGDGPLRRTLERQAGDLGIRSSVIFAGHRSDVPELLNAMDVFVLPTRREGFGVVFAEAMAMKKPVVGSMIGPVAEVVEDGVTGFLVPPQSAEQFAERVVQLLCDEEKRKTFGEAGRRRVEARFSEAHMCVQIEKQYQALLASKGLI